MSDQMTPQTARNASLNAGEFFVTAGVTPRKKKNIIQPFWFIFWLLIWEKWNKLILFVNLNVEFKKVHAILLHVTYIAMKFYLRHCKSGQCYSDNIRRNPKVPRNACWISLIEKFFVIIDISPFEYGRVYGVYIGSEYYAN